MTTLARAQAFRLPERNRKMARATRVDRSRAQALRRRARNGRKPLTRDEVVWLARYEHLHPSTVVPSVAELVAPAAPVSRETDEPDDDDVSVFQNSETSPQMPVDSAALAVVDAAPAKERMEQIEADMFGHGANLLVRAVELHERVSERALAMLERVEAMQAQQSEQLVDAMTALAEARARAIEAEAGVGDEPAEGERTDRLEAMLAQMAGPALKSMMPAAPAPKPPRGT